MHTRYSFRDYALLIIAHSTYIWYVLCSSSKRLPHSLKCVRVLCSSFNLIYLLLQFNKSLHTQRISLAMYNTAQIQGTYARNACVTSLNVVTKVFTCRRK